MYSFTDSKNIRKRKKKKEGMERKKEGVHILFCCFLFSGIIFRNEVRGGYCPWYSSSHPNEKSSSEEK